MSPLARTARAWPRLAASSALTLTLAATVAGCGEERTSPTPPQSGVVGGGVKRVDLPKAGIRFDAPGFWRQQPGDPPLAILVASGRSIAAVWRYPRTEPLPRTPAALQRARRALVAASEGRGQDVRIDASRIVRVRGVPGVELVGSQTLRGQPRRMRSTHLYAFGAEVVVDGLAPTEEFDRVDAGAFRPMIRSLRLRKPRP